MMEAIGGHEGMTVWRTPDGIRKTATTDRAWSDLLREAQWLVKLGGDHAPRLLDSHPKECWTLQEDLGQALSLDSNPVVALGTAQFWDDCVDLLAAFRRAGIDHGDLTPPNLAWTEHRGLCALDWQESTLRCSTLPRKRDTTDAWQLLDTFLGLAGIDLQTLWSVR